MTLHATEQLRNIRATLRTFIRGLTLSGSPTFAEAEEPRREAEPSPWLRVSITLEPGSYDGHDSAGRLAFWTPVVVTADLLWPRGGAAASKGLYEIDDAASALAGAFRQLHLPLRDYATNPSSPPVVAGGHLQFRSAPTPRSLPATDAWQRRQVVAEGRFHLRHTPT